MRATSYSLHIRPLFTAIDIEHMKAAGLDLSVHDDVRANADAILRRLKGGAGVRQMPPASTTGPWPEEWIALFERWTSEGCPQ